MNSQIELTPRHRSIVINWLVVLQEMFGLNHEVLYMAVELIDLYLMKNNVTKNKFQLLASAAILLSNKIDVSNKCKYFYFFYFSIIYFVFLYR